MDSRQYGWSNLLLLLLRRVTGRVTGRTKEEQVGL